MKQQEHQTIELLGVSRRSRWRKPIKILLILGAIFGVLVIGTTIYLNNYVHKKFKATQRTDIIVDPCPKNGSCNILVLGSDRRSVVDKAERNQRQFRGGGSQRADTILLIHVPANGRSAVILSFPRDLRVHIPGTRGFSKINAAYQGIPSKHIKGSNLMMDTIRGLTGLKINHYIEVNFASFQSIVDAVGGVKLCPKKAYDDRESGLILRHAGCQQFNGKLALAWVRMRKQDPKGDFGRIDRQQQFMRVLMQKVKGIGFLTDIPRLTKLADVMSKGVITDSKLTLAEVRGIANKLAGFKQSNVDFRVVPSYPKYIAPVSWVIERPAEANALFLAIKNDTSLPDFGKTAASIATPADVTIRILNGTTTAGLAADVRDRLRGLGYKVLSTGNASKRDYSKTVVLYSPGDEAKALLVIQEFPGAVLRQSGSTLTSDVEVILGADEAARASPGPSP